MDRKDGQSHFFLLIRIRVYLPLRTLFKAFLLYIEDLVRPSHNDYFLTFSIRTFFGMRDRLFLTCPDINPLSAVERQRSSVIGALPPVQPFHHGCNVVTVFSLNILGAFAETLAPDFKV